MANKESSRSRLAQKRQRLAQNQRRRWFLAAAVIGLLSVGVVYVLWTRTTTDSVSRERFENYPVLGNSEAKVVITEFGDFGCSSCRAWHEAGIRDNILHFYGQEVAFVWRDFPVVTSRSPKAAQAAQCAHDQGQFWAYHDYVYEHGQRLSESSLKAYASDIELDTLVFNECLDSDKYQRIAEKGIEDARQLRLRGTPSFLVNGQALAGPPPFRYLAELIDQELAEAQND